MASDKTPVGAIPASSAAALLTQPVRVINVGPTKRINPLLRWTLGIRKDDLFHDDWTTHFSPVYSVFDHWWTSPDETREARMRWRLYIFFCPIDAVSLRTEALGQLDEVGIAERDRRRPA